MSQEGQPSAETTSPVSSSHEIAREPLCTADRLAQERRQFVVDKAAREAERFAQDLEAMAAGGGGCGISSGWQPGRYDT